MFLSVLLFYFSSISLFLLFNSYNTNDHLNSFPKIFLNESLPHTQSPKGKHLLLKYESTIGTVLLLYKHLSTLYFILLLI